NAPAYLLGLECHGRLDGRRQPPADLRSPAVLIQAVLAPRDGRPGRAAGRRPLCWAHETPVAGAATDAVSGNVTPLGAYARTTSETPCLEVPSHDETPYLFSHGGDV